MDLLEKFTHSNFENVFKEKIVKNHSKGIDKKSFKSFLKKEEKETLFKGIGLKIQTKKYSFSPYLELLRIKKRNTSPRMISIPTVRDKIVLNILKSILHDLFPNSINKEQPNSYIKKIKNYIAANKGKDIHYIKVDISHFYDNIRWKELKNILSNNIDNKYIIKLILDAIKTPTVPANYSKEDIGYYKPKRGVPQGLPISNILAQVYLETFDLDCLKQINKSSLYLRYVDDIIILTTEKEINYVEIINNSLKKIGLKLNSEKTKTGNIRDTVDFLGYLITEKNITIGKRTIENQINKIAGKITWFKKGIDNEKTRPLKYKNDQKGFANQFIKEVNEIITGSKSNKKNYGWLFYYVEIDDLSVLFKLDKIVAELIKSIAYFNNKIPKKLKKSSRAFSEIKLNKGGNYINDYDKLKTTLQKKKLLIEASAIDENREYNKDEIESEFITLRERNLKLLNEKVVY